MHTIEAVYEHGVLRPLQKLDLPEHAQVALAILESSEELLLAAQQRAAARQWDDPALDVYNEWGRAGRRGPGLLPADLDRAGDPQAAAGHRCLQRRQ